MHAALHDDSVELQRHTIFTKQHSSVLHTTHWVCPSICLLQSLTVSKRLEILSTFTPPSQSKWKRKSDIAVRNRKQLTETRNHMPYGITQRYLPPGSGDFPIFTPAETGTRFSDPRGRDARLSSPEYAYPAFKGGATGIYWYIPKKQFSRRQTTDDTLWL